MRMLKASAAANVMVFMTDAGDHVTGITGRTLTITESKNGGAFAAITPTVTERGSGWYSLALTAAHTDTEGDLALHITATGADPSDLICRVFVDTIVDAVWDEPLTGATHNVATSAGRRLRQVNAFSQVDAAVADASPSASSFITTLTDPVDDAYHHLQLTFTSGSLLGEAYPILTYDGTTKRVTIDGAFTAAPDNGDTFSIISIHIHPLTSIANAVRAEMDANSTQLAGIDAATVLALKLLRNKRVLNPADGIETIYDDDGSVLFTRSVFEDAAGTQPYRDSGADRVERYT